MGHEWRCLRCNSIVHEEALVGFEETEEAAGERHVRIADAVKGHACPKEEKEEHGTDTSEG